MYELQSVHESGLRINCLCRNANRRVEDILFPQHRKNLTGNDIRNNHHSYLDAVCEPEESKQKVLVIKILSWALWILHRSMYTLFSKGPIQRFRDSTCCQNVDMHMPLLVNADSVASLWFAHSLDIYPTSLLETNIAVMEAHCITSKVELAIGVTKCGNQYGVKDSCNSSCSSPNTIFVMFAAWTVTSISLFLQLHRLHNWRKASFRNHGKQIHLHCHDKWCYAFSKSFYTLNFSVKSSYFFPLKEWCFLHPSTDSQVKHSLVIFSVLN